MSISCTRIGCGSTLGRERVIAGTTLKKSLRRRAKPRGLAGGPGTLRGVAYQSNYAVFLALHLIAEELAVPYRGHTLGIEPRVDAAGRVVDWDIGVGPGVRLIEAKAQPRKADILEWFLRLGGHGASDILLEFVYGEGGGDYLQAAKTLVLLARDATDEVDFRSLLAAAGPLEQELAAAVGANAFSILPRCSLRCFPADVVAEQTREQARLVAGSIHEPLVTAWLFKELTTGGATRRSFKVRGLIDSLRAAGGVTLAAPPIIGAPGLDEALGGVLFALQVVSPHALPLEVLASAVDADLDGLWGRLSAVTGKDVLTLDAGLLRIASLPTQLTQAQWGAALPGILRALLSYVGENGLSVHARRLVPCCYALGQACVDQDPALVARLFLQLDKLSKQVGDRHVILDLAELSITASRRQPRDSMMVQGEAQALVCGRSWVYQRVNRLDEAKAAAEKSLHLGEGIGWTRNTAYCRKCIGRLHRLLGEAATGPDRDNHLRESERDLREAIRLFSTMDEFGRDHQEVGDCFSLLARTCLVAGRLDDAEAALKEAYARIPSDGSKDYIDLLLVTGDIDLARGRARGVIASFEEALTLTGGDDPEMTELRARAFLARGRAAIAAGDRKAAADAFFKASDVYTALQERMLAARATWEAYNADGGLPAEARDALGQESDARVRMLALRLHEEAMAAAGGGARVGRRSGTTETYWRQVLQRARAVAVLEDVGW